MRTSSTRAWKVTAAALALFALGASSVAAQSPASPADRIGWTQPATAAELPQLTFAVLVDGVRQPLPGFVCRASEATPVSPATPDSYECAAPFPPMTPGVHTLELIAIRTDGAVVLESPKAAALGVRMVVGPATPTNPRLVRGGAIP